MGASSGWVVTLYLDRVPGFVEFHLLKGPEGEDHTLYALPYGVAEQSRLRGVDQIGGVPRRACRAGNDATGPLYPGPNSRASRNDRR